MKLWIRNQDKTRLVEATNISVEEITLFNPNNTLTINNYQKVVGGRLLVNGIYFAKYETIERAIEILDEIQQHLTGKLVTNKTSKSKVKEGQTDNEPEQNLFNGDVIYQVPAK